MAGLPDDVSKAAARHLDAADAVLPGLVARLYITGSAALGDYQPGRSDIDFVAFTSRPLSAADLTALASMHGSFLDSGPAYDGVYLELDELPEVPDDGRPAPHLVDGQFRADTPCGELTPSTWTEFSRYAIAIRGPQAAGLGITISGDRLRKWQLGNLNSYWRDLADGAAKVWSERDQESLVPDPATVTWCALGPPRLHYTLASGDITSKTGAGHYARQHFPEYAEVISQTLRWRATGDGSFSHAAGVRVTELMRALISDANQRWGGSG